MRRAQKLTLVSRVKSSQALLKITYDLLCSLSLMSILESSTSKYRTTFIEYTFRPPLSFFFKLVSWK